VTLPSSSSSSAPGGAVIGADLIRSAVIGGTVIRLNYYGAAVKLNGGRVGLIHISQISDAVVELETLFSIGQRCKVMIIDDGKVSGQVSLSTRTLEPSPGDILRGMETVFAQAEVTAHKYHEKHKGVENSLESNYGQNWRFRPSQQVPSLSSILPSSSSSFSSTSPSHNTVSTIFTAAPHRTHNSVGTGYTIQPCVHFQRGQYAYGDSCHKSHVMEGCNNKSQQLKQTGGNFLQPYIARAQSHSDSANDSNSPRSTQIAPTLGAISFMNTTVIN
jgi:predicted RNA-binding protein with RPS1 domain